MNSEKKHEENMELLHTSTNVNDTNKQELNGMNDIPITFEDITVDKKKNEMTHEMWEVVNTPFTIVRENQTYFVTLGNYRLSGDLQSMEEAKDDASREDWNRIMQVMTLVIKHELKTK